MKFTKNVCLFYRIRYELKSKHAANMNFCIKIILLSLLISTSNSASAELLEEKAKDAALKCMRVDSYSLAHCGFQMTGRSAAHSEARKSVKQMFELREMYINNCSLQNTHSMCVENANWFIEMGISQIYD